MSSRKEQKEQLRKEREAREAAAKAAAQRKRLVGYGAAIALVAAVVIVLVVVVVGGGDDGGGKGVGSEVLPDGGSVPEQKATDLTQAAKAAGCEVKSFKATSREHTEDLAEQISYPSTPPTSGKHFVTPAEDGAYEEAPDAKELLHTMEHGRMVIWFRPKLPEDDRANLAALFEEDTYQMVITPDPTRMKYAVAATAWTAEPQPNGTGRLLGCPKMGEGVFDAIRAFKDEHRSNGPEPVP